VKVNIKFDIPNEKYNAAKAYWETIPSLNMSWKKWIIKILTDNIDVKHLKVNINK